MKNPAIISKKWLTVIYSIWGLIVIYAVIFFIQKHSTWKREITIFKSKEIHSRIFELRNLNRGTFLIRVFIDNELKSFDLPISHEVDKYKIIPGDSLTKKSNFDTFEIFRTDSFGVNKICNIKI